MFLVRLHVIQFTRYSSKLPALAVSLYILAHRFAFVKNFFQVFQTFLFIDFRFSMCRFPTGQLANINTRLEVCQELFSNFVSCFLVAVLSENFDILAHQLNFVKYFFQLFSKSFLHRHSATLAEVLAYTNRTTANCQALFSLFFDYFF